MWDHTYRYTHVHADMLTNLPSQCYHKSEVRARDSTDRSDNSSLGSPNMKCNTEMHKYKHWMRVSKRTLQMEKEG
jgi:hypothetical protein